VLTDTAAIDYVRDVTYRQAWLTIAGRYSGDQRSNATVSLSRSWPARTTAASCSIKAKGTELPTKRQYPCYDANDDFKKNDVGLIAGLQYKLNIGKKDLSAASLGLRANLGLADLDATCTPNAECNPDPNLYNGAHQPPGHLTVLQL
jgi:hypothetical protein